MLGTRYAGAWLIEDAKLAPGIVINEVEALRVQCRIVRAVLLRDLKTRFGRSFFGWATMVLWPLTHLVFIVLGYVIAHRIAPFGNSVTVFIGTGVLPYILCLYPARMIMLCLVQNYPLLLFPPVQSVDIIIARGILEIVNAFWVVALFCLGLFVINVDFIPTKPEIAIQAIFATIYLGFAIGFVSAVIFKIFKPFVAIQIGLLLLGYITSGAFMPVTNLPPAARNILWFNPFVHLVEWLRSAYFDSYAGVLLNPGYVLGYATILLLLGLVLERILRGLILAHN